MLKFWLRLYKDGKLIGDTVCDSDEKLSAQKILDEGLHTCCYSLDIPNPIIMKKHIADIKSFSLTRFLPDDFPEAVGFDKAEITVFDDSKAKKKG